VSGGGVGTAKALQRYYPQNPNLSPTPAHRLSVAATATHFRLPSAFQLNAFRFLFIFYSNVATKMAQTLRSYLCNSFFFPAAILVAPEMQ